MLGKIFISYRRDDDPGFAGRLYDRLQKTFSRRIFMDVDSIEPGQIFPDVIQSQLDQCDVLLVVIGRGWIEAKDEAGRRRLDDPNDFVRIEIAMGLKLNKRVIPVLVHDTDMPAAKALPEELMPLVSRQGMRLTHERFRADAERLVKTVKAALDEAEAMRRAANTAAELVDDATHRPKSPAPITFPVTLILPTVYGTFGDPIYVAGSFNNWLNAEAGRLNVDLDTLAGCRLETVRRRKLKSRQVTINLPPGEYEFKFVTKQFRWLPWVATSQYEKGQDADDGPNFLIRVG